jgi:hypothetical protein
VSLLLEVAQEVAHHIGADLLDRDVGGISSIVLGEEAKEQPERVPIAFLRIAAEVSLEGLFEEKAADERAEQVRSSHGGSP